MVGLAQNKGISLSFCKRYKERAVKAPDTISVS